MTQKERMQNLREIQDPAYGTQRHVERLFGQIQVVKGDKGDTPIKGVDYFTPREIQAIIATVRSMVRDGRDGIQGEKGMDGINGRDGYSPVLGHDYWTEEDRKSVVAEVQKGIKDGKDGKSPKADDIVALVVKQLAARAIPYGKLEGAPDPKDLAQLIAFLKRGGYRGGGSSSSTPSSAGSIINATNSGDGQHYTLAKAPTTTAYYVLINNGIYTTDDTNFSFSVASTALTFTSPLPADLANTIIKLVCV